MGRLGTLMVAVLLLTSTVSQVTAADAEAITSSGVEPAGRSSAGDRMVDHGDGPTTGVESREASPTAGVTAVRRSTNRTVRGNTGHEPWFLYVRDVNTANGNLFRSERDVSIGARGGDIAFARSYNSNLSARHGPLGFGWTHNYGMHLREGANGSIVLFDADGSTHTFAWTGDGYEAPPGVHARLEENGSGHVLRRTTGHELVFDPAGTLLRITDRNDNSIHLEYAGGELVEIRDDSGQNLTLTYNAEGRISAVTDPLGRTVRYRYDAGDLVEVVDVTGRSTRYAYYENHKLQRIDGPSDVPVVYRYYAGSDRVRCVGADSEQASDTCAEAGYTFEYDYANDSVAVVNGLTGNRTSIVLNAAGSPVSVDAPEGTAEVGWDGDRNRITVRNDSGTYRFEYDDAGNPIRKTDDAGNTVRLGWKTVATGDTYVSLLMNRTTPRGYTTEYRYDAEGNLIEATDPRSETRRFRYDRFGNLVAETDPEGHTTRYVYDEHGFRTAVVGPTGAATNYTYDAAGRMVGRTDPRGNTERFERNARGDVVRVTDPTGNVTEYDYDADGRLRKAVVPTGREIPAGAPWSPSPAADATFERGNRSLTIRTGEYTVVRRFDAEGRPVSVTVDFGSFTRRVDYAYDAGSLVAVETPDGTIRYEHDELDRVTYVGGPNGTWANYTYDGAGRRVRTVYSSGVTTRYGYDAAGRVLSIRTEHPNGSTLLNYSYTYDAAGNRLTATDTDGGVTRYGYDALDRLIEVTRPSGETVEYAYDAVGHRLSRTVNGTRTTRYVYGADGELERVEAPNATTTFTYDSDGATAEKRVGANTTTYEYGQTGRLQRVSTPDGDRVSFTYLPGGERLSKTTDGETTYYLYSAFDVVATFDGDGTLTRRYLHGPGVDDPVALVEGGEAYFYHQDGPTNVRALTDGDGRIVNRYRYAPFGEIERASETVANPYRYAARRYDAESGLYYNRHRYYDPDVGRFTKRDPAGLTAGINLYGYADNNPVNYRDPSGLDAWTGLLEGGGFMAGLVGFGVYSGQLVNPSTGQACSVNIYNLKIGVGLGIAGGIQGTVQSGPHCGTGLGGSSLSAYAAAAGGGATGSISAGEGGASATGGAGVSGGLTLEGGVTVGEVTVNGCTCVCEECEHYCEEGQCDDPEDNPDDNHDLSVMTYSRQYPNGGEGPPEFGYQGASVAVLTRGFSAELNDFLVSIDETPASVGFGTDQEHLDRFNVLVVPTGGLQGISTLQSLERKLRRFVERGGTLVVMPQKHGYDLAPVPGDLAGFGWREDQSCQFASVGIDTFCPVLASQRDAVADVNVDGYFTDYPENATVLLTRTKNGQPAMLKYRYGEGRVFATAAYTDWAYGHHASNEEGRELLRDLIRRAKRPGNVSTYGPGEQITLSVNVTSYVDTSADEVDVRLTGPSGVTRRTVDPPDGLRAFDSRTVTFTTTVPESAPRGLWTVEYSLVNASHGVVQRGRRSGRFAVSTLRGSGEGWTYQRSNLSLSVTSSAERFARGSNATFGITVRNRGATAETVTVWWSYPHNYWNQRDPMYGSPGTTTPGHASSRNRTLEVPAGGERTITDQIPVYADVDRLWAEFYRGNRSSTERLGRVSKGFFTFRPAIDLDVATDRNEYTPGNRVSLNLTAEADGAPNSTVDVRVIAPGNRRVYADEVNATPGPDGSWGTTLAFDLPASAVGGHYTVIADARKRGDRVGYAENRFVVPSLIPGIVPSVPETLENDTRFEFAVENRGRRNLSNATLSVSLIDPAGAVAWNESVPVDVDPGDRQQFAFRPQFGTLSLGTYRLRYALAYDDGSRATRAFELPNELTVAVEFERPSYDAGETANATVTVTNDGRFAGTQRVGIAVPESGFNETRRLELDPYENATVGASIPLTGTITSGQHGTVTLGMANAVTRDLDLFVRPSRLSLSMPEARYGAGDSIAIDLANPGGVNTTADCSVVLYGPQGRTVYDDRTRPTVRHGGNVTLRARLPPEAVGGAYLLSIECANGNRNTGTELLKSVPVSGLTANVSSTTARTVFAGGEDVPITATVRNLNGRIENGTLTVRVINASARDPEGGASGLVDRTGTASPTAGSVERNGSGARLREQDRRGIGTTTGDGDDDSTLESRTEPNRTDQTLATGLPDPFPENRTGEVALTGQRTNVVDGLSDVREPDAPGSVAPSNVGRNQTIRNETVWADTRKVLDRSLVIDAAGNLTLRNTTVVFENSADGEHGLVVESGGELHVLDGSNVTVLDSSYRSYFVVDPNTTFEMRDSTVADIGYSNVYDINRSGLYVDTDGAVVENASILNDQYGLILNDSDGSVVTGTFVSGYRDDGILVRDSDGVRMEANRLSFASYFSAAGIDLRRSNGTVVAGNRFDGNDGVSVATSNDVDVLDNYLASSGAEIRLWDSGASTVSNNTLRDGSIDISSSDGNNVSGNTIVADYSPIELYDADRNVVADNNVSAIEITYSEHNDVRDNTLDGDNSGVALVSSGNSTVSGNDIDGMSRYGIYLEGSLNVTVRDNVVNGSDDHDFFVTGTNRNNDGGALRYYRHETANNTVTDGPLYYWVNRSDASIPADAGAAWLVDTDGVTVTNGSTVVLVYTENATVRDVTVEDGWYGIYLFRSNDTTIADATVADNEYGIVLQEARNNEISGNDVSLTGGRTGITAEFSNWTTVADNEVTDTRYADQGVYLYYSSHSTVARNDLSGVGITMYRARGWRGESRFNDVRNNTLVEGSITLAGGSTYVRGPSNNSVTGNHISGQRSEIWLDGAPSNRVRNNTLTGGAEKILLGRSDFNTVADNRLENTVDGIELESSDSNTVVRNVVRNLSSTYRAGGVVLESGSSFNTLRDNTISGTGEGVLLTPYGSPLGNNRILGNEVSRITNDAFRLTGAPNTTVVGNDVSGAGGYGLYVSTSVNATVRNNTFERTGSTLFVGSDADLNGVDHRELRYYLHDVDASNTFDGRSLYYLVNETDRAAPDGGATVWVVNGDNVTVDGDAPAAFVHTANSTVRNVDVSGHGYGVYLRNGSDNAVLDVSATNGSYGVLTEGSRGATIDNVTATGNGWGVYFRDTVGATLRGSNASFSDHGIWFEDTSATTVDDSVVRNNTDVGVGLNETDGTSSSNRLLDSTITGIQDGDGVFVWGAENNTIAGNTIAYVEDDGIYLNQADNSTIAGNTVAYSGYQGIDVVRTDDSTIANNTVANNDRAGIDVAGDGWYSDGSDGNLIYNNYLRNGVNAYDYGENNRWNVTKQPGENIVGGPFLGGNYWSEYGGSDLDGDDLGDTGLPYNSSGHLGAGGDYHPLIIVEPTGPVVWSTNATVDVAANATESFQFTVPAAALSDVDGKLKLASNLTSSIGQPIDEQDPSFYVIDGDTIVTLETDKAVYEPNESVVLSGVVENNGSVERTYALSVGRNGTEIATRDLTLAPGENGTYSVTTRSAGSFIATATAGNVTVRDRVEVSAPSVDATLRAPDVVGRDEFAAGVLLENTGDVPADLDVTVANGSPESVTLAPGTSELVERSIRIDANATLDVVVSGDVDRTLRKTVVLGERVDIRVAPKGVYTPGPVAIPYTIENTGQLGTGFDFTAEIGGRAVRRAVYLSPGGNTSGVLRTNLTEGEYALRYSTPFETGETGVSVARRNQIELDAAVAGTVTDDGRLPVNVTIRNVGPNDVYGSLRANSTVFFASREFNVSAGGVRSLRLTVDVPGGAPAGQYDLGLRAVSEGAVLAERTARFEVTAPRFEVVAAPSKRSFRIGDRVALDVTVRNTGGDAGRGRVNVSVPGIHQSRPAVWLAPGERTNRTVSFLLPDDLRTGQHVASYAADGTGATTVLSVDGLNASATASLDEPTYEDGENATLTLRVTNPGSREVSLFSRVKFNDYDVVRNYTLAGGETTSLAFEVPIAFGGDEKIFYGVYAESGRSLYINGLRPHRNRSENVTLYTDAPVYDIGETATVRLRSHAAGEVAVSAPGFGWREVLPAGATRNLSFAVPALKSGTYYVHYSFENRSHSYPFDVSGYHVRVSETHLDGERHVEGDPVALTLAFESSRAVPGSVVVEIRGPGQRLLDTARADVSLAAGKNEVTVVGELPSDASGIHAITYRIVADTSPQVTLADRTEFFEVHERPTSVFAYAPTSPAVGEILTFDAAGSTAPDGSIATYEWDFDGDGSVDATGATVEHAFAAAGNYTVTLTVTDGHGTRATTNRTVAVVATRTTCVDGAVAGEDGLIGLTEVQQAINWWADDTEVPGTGGETISLSEIQDLINAWAEDRAVSC